MQYWTKCLCSKNFCFDILVAYKLFNLFWNMFTSKAIKVCCIVRCSHIIIIHIRSYPITSYCFVLIKIYHICCIFYFRLIVYQINTIKSRFIFVTFCVSLYFSSCNNSFTYSNNYIITSSFSFSCWLTSNKLERIVTASIPRNLLFVLLHHF